MHTDWGSDWGSDWRNYGSVNRAKWALILKAPLSASGFNEILVTARTKKELGRMVGRKQFGENSQFAMVRIDDLKMSS